MGFAVGTTEAKRSNTRELLSLRSRRPVETKSGKNHQNTSGLEIQSSCCFAFAAGAVR